MKKTFVLAVMVLCFALGATAHCWEDAFTDPKIKTVDGKVADVDVQGSSITITSVDTMTFSVPASARVVHNVYDMKLSDVKAGDYVTIDYYDDPPGKLEAKVITVHYEEGEGI